MENVFLTSLTTPEVKQMFRDELVKFFTDFKTPILNETSSEQDQNLSIEELAKYLKVSISTANRYKKRGVVPFFQTGRTVYFKKSLVDAALAVGNSKGIKNG